MSGSGIEVWCGGVAAWECDEMGHLNVGFYLAKASEAHVYLTWALGLPSIFKSDAKTTVVVRDQHVRFMREARAGRGMRMDRGVKSIGDSDARLFMLLSHPDGTPSAAYQSVISYIDVATGEELPWPDDVIAKARDLTIEIPEKVMPRSCGLDVFETSASIQRADELCLTRCTLGAVRPNDCDVFGRMHTEQMIARSFEGAGNLARKNGSTHDPLEGIGGAALEYRLRYLRWPAVGDLLDIRAGWQSAEPKVRRLVYWVLDPVSGLPWGVHKQPWCHWT